MAHLPPYQKDVIAYVERKYESRRLSWNANRQRETLFRILDFYQLLGIDRLAGQQIVQAAGTNGPFTPPTLPPVTEAAVNRRIFGENV